MASQRQGGGGAPPWVGRKRAPSQLNSPDFCGAKLEQDPLD